MRTDQLGPELAAEIIELPEYVNQKLSPGSSIRALWRCPEGHLYRAQVRQRRAGKSCHVCAGGVTWGVDDLMTTHPGLVADMLDVTDIPWDASHPANLTAKSRASVRFLCPSCYQPYNAKVCDEVAVRACPACGVLPMWSGGAGQLVAGLETALAHGDRDSDGGQVLFQISGRYLYVHVRTRRSQTWIPVGSSMGINPAAIQINPGEVLRVFRECDGVEIDFAAARIFAGNTIVRGSLVQPGALPSPPRQRPDKPQSLDLDGMVAWTETATLLGADRVACWRIDEKEAQVCALREDVVLAIGTRIIL